MVIFWSFCDVITPISDEFFMITRKIKIGEFLYYFLHSIFFFNGRPVVRPCLAVADVRHAKGRLRPLADRGGADCSGGSQCGEQAPGAEEGAAPRLELEACFP